jgi:hypothetical protein
MIARCRPEQTIQRAVIEHLAVRRTPRTFAFHVPNGGARSKIEAAILKGLGVVAGVPDVIAIRDGRTFCDGIGGRGISGIAPEPDMARMWQYRRE